MRTLVFCTSYSHSTEFWDQRHALWVKSIRSSDLQHTQLLIVDDASPALPLWGNVQIVHESDLSLHDMPETDAPILLYRFDKHLGRKNVFDFPGWHRSFSYALKYGYAKGFDKIIHLESDAHLTSDRIQRHFNNFDDGWTALWCQQYTFPEIAVQCIAGSAIERANGFACQPYDNMVGRNHENMIPIELVDKTFKGDRYGERFDIVPPDADFCAQVVIGADPDHYWWLDPVKYDEEEERELCVKLSPPFDKNHLSGFWSTEEPSFHWTIGKYESCISFVLTAALPFWYIKMHVVPCVFEGSHSQEIFVLVNGQLMHRSNLRRESYIFITPPLKSPLRCGVNTIMLLHPDGFSPNLAYGHSEDRELAVGVGNIEVWSIKDLRRLEDQCA